jgi:3-oxoacyl-[acyl-carrier protein] reductase
MHNNKLAIVTGASRGIGKAAAINFARLGYDVALLAKNKSLLQKLSTELTNTYNVKTGVFNVDVSDKEEVNACISHILQHHSRIDIVFNNAGVLATGLLDIDDKDIIKQIETNLLGAYYVLKAVVPQMKQQRFGYIFNVASRSGKVAIPKFGAYSATKYALVGINEALYAEMMPYNVKVTALCPSVVDTDLSKDFNIPNEEKIQVDDIVNTVNYLLTLSPSAWIKELDIECKYVILNPYDASQ